MWSLSESASAPASLNRTSRTTRRSVRTIVLCAFAALSLQAGSFAATPITLVPGPVLSFQDNPGVQLEFPAGPGGITVHLTSSNPAVAPVPATVFIAAGHQSATFTIKTAKVPANVTVTSPPRPTESVCQGL
jgi:hypothetical protein